MGFPVQKCAEGYYCCEEVCESKTDVKYSSRAYLLMILQVLDGTPKSQAEIIRAVQEKYGVKIGRRAVKGHFELLKAMHFKGM